jgi:putative heme-binding domain-containing protein
LERALTDHTPHPAVATSVSAHHRRTGQLPPGLATRFLGTAAGSLSAALLRENRVTLAADVARLGDPVRGEQIFRRPAAACAACHAIGSAGPTLGPNLAALGSATDTSYIVDSILEPSKAIAEHYETTQISLRDGTVRVGVIAAKGEREVVLRDPVDRGQEIRIPVESIREIKTLDSLMPVGLADQLQSRQEFLDLSRFITLLGRSGPYANDESPVIRKWRIAAATAPLPLTEEHPSWTTEYSYVSGELRASVVGPSKPFDGRGHVQVQVAGAVLLKLNSTSGLRLWIDGREVTDFAAPIALGRGRVALTFRVDPSQRGGTGLRVELAPAPGSPVKLQPVGGL